MRERRQKTGVEDIAGADRIDDRDGGSRSGDALPVRTNCERSVRAALDDDDGTLRHMGSDFGPRFDRVVEAGEGQSGPINGLMTLSGLAAAAAPKADLGGIPRAVSGRKMPR